MFRSSKKELRDELVWAAVWLYRRTGKKNYLKDAEQNYKNFKLGTLVSLIYNKSCTQHT